MGEVSSPGPGDTGGEIDAQGMTLRERGVTLRIVHLGAPGVSGVPVPRPAEKAT